MSAATTDTTNDGGVMAAEVAGDPLPAQREWLRNIYYPTLDVSIGTAYTYMHTTVNWTVSLVTAIVLFLATRSSFPDELSWIALWISLLMVSHFASRTAKAYVNVLRWAAIQREMLKGFLDGRPNAEVEFVRKYHIAWQSPIPLRTVLYKLSFELGFGYLYAVIGAVIAYTTAHVRPSAGSIIVAALAAAGVLCELALLAHVCGQRS